MNDLQEYVKYLKAKGRLAEINARVSAELEVTAFTDAASRERKRDAKTLLFNKVEDYDIPVVTNLFGSRNTLSELFTNSYAIELLSELSSMMASGKGLSIVKAGKMLLDSKPKYIESGLDKYRKLDSLDELPILKSWPKDAGKFITLPLVITQSPRDKSYNTGIYRMQVFDNHTTGMHWQAQKGGAIHASEAHEKGERLNAAVSLGTDPYSMIAAITPLPHGINEFAFAGMLREKQTVMMKNGEYPAVPANSEIIINGHVDPDDRRLEGPFGDHTGYYGTAEEYPVFHIDSIYAKKNPIYPASVVGHPWHEDATVIEFLGDLLKPVIKSMNPAIVDIYAPAEGIFTNMCFVSIKKRFPGEAKKVMFSVLGMGQLSFLKIIVVFDDDIDIRDMSQVTWALATRIEPQRDVQIITGATADSLDHTTNIPAFGSKMLIDATKKTKEEGYTREWPDTISLPKELVDEVEKKWKLLGK